MTTLNLAPLEKLIAESEAHDTHKADLTLQPREGIKAISDERGLGFNFSEKNLTMYAKPSENFTQQLHKKLAPAVFGKGTNKTLPSDLYLAFHPELRAYNYNDHLAHHGNGNWKVRLYDDNARAVLDGKYPGGADTQGRYDNTQYLTALYDILSAQAESLHSLKVVRSTVTPNDFTLRVVMRDGFDSDEERAAKGKGNYGIGVAISNSETGRAKLSVHQLIWRTSCTNSVALGENSYEQIHRGNMPAIKTLFLSAITQALEFSGDALNRVFEAEAQHIPSFADTLKGLAIQYGWSEETAQKVAIGTEGQETRMGIVNGVSCAAHQLHTDPLDQLYLEKQAGALLTAPDSLFAVAAHNAQRAKESIKPMAMLPYTETL